MNERNIKEKSTVKDFFEKQDEVLLKGKKIVTVLVVLKIVGNLIGIVLAFPSFASIIANIVGIVFAVLLYNGVPWVKWLYFISSCLSAVVGIFSLPSVIPTLGTLGGVGILLISAMIVEIAVSVISAVLILSKPVSEFLYYQKNG